MVEQPLQNLSRPVARVSGDAVAAEYVVGRVTARELHGQHYDDRREQHAVDEAELAQDPSHPASVEPRQDERSSRQGRYEHDRLGARKECDQADSEQDALPLHSRSFERENERERDACEQRIEDRFRHQCPRVHQRRNRKRKAGGEERPRRPQHPPCDEIHRNRGERHGDGADRLRRRVGIRDRVEEPPSGCDQQRIDHAVRSVMHVADEEVARRREALREL